MAIYVHELLEDLREGLDSVDLHILKAHLLGVKHEWGISFSKDFLENPAVADGVTSYSFSVYHEKEKILDLVLKINAVVVLDVVKIY